MKVRTVFAIAVAAAFTTPIAMAADQDRATGGSPVPHAGQQGARSADAPGGAATTGAAAGGTAGSAASAGAGSQMSFERLDANRDGSITRQEASSMDRGHFDQLDTDRDGKLSATELGGVAASPGK